MAIESIQLELQLLFLLLVANGAPVLARRLLGDSLAPAVDSGRLAWDGRPWLGPSKTWRGILASLLATVPSALLVGLDAGTGALVAGGAMLGDLFSSFLKRRLGIPASGQALGLDQVPESLFPLLLAGPRLGLSHLALAAIVVAFVFLELALSRILYRLNIRRQPY
jgi:CDP-2,3-bis-(O-geranylgeranyl)-sn-glycerol synthase